MEIKHIQAIEGANVYSHSPVIRAIVDLQEWDNRTSETLGEFNGRLLACLPGLEEHYCSRGRRGGFLERLAEGTLLGHIIEHVAIEILTQAGQTIKYGRTRTVLNAPGCYEVVFNYQSKEGGLEAFQQAFRLVNSLLKEEEADSRAAIESVKEKIRTYEPGVSTKVIMEACQQRGIPVQCLAGSLLQLGFGCHQHRVQAAMTDRTSCIAVDIAGDKCLTKDLLHQSGIPVPLGHVVYSEEEALQALTTFKGPVVIKPYNGNQGKGVSLQLNTEREVRTAFRVAQAYDQKVIVEEYIRGRHYRLLVAGGEVVAAAERIPAHVTGDGMSTVEELIEITNQDPDRGEDHEKSLSKIKVDPVVLLTLSQKKLTLDSVPQAGESVYLRDSANLSTGGIARDVTDQVHPHNRDLAAYAARIVGLDIAGIDLVVEDIGISYRDGNGHVIEVNAAPGLRMHCYPSLGQGKDVGRIIVDQAIPYGNGRIPIVAVTGTNGKTTITRMIGKLLMDQQMHVGMTTTSGTYIDGRLLVEGDMTGPDSARMILRHPQIQVAVLETARGGILRGGLAYDYADVAVISNVSNDHLGQYGIETVEEIAHVKSLVAEVVQPHSYVVLNADDPLVVKMAQRTRGKVILFSLEKDNLHVRKHLARGGAAVFVRRGIILICSGETSYKLLPVRRLPVAWEGRARHNLQNALAATAAGWALGFSAQAISASLQSFESDAVYNRGRLNYYDINGLHVWIDYGHNGAGIEAVIETLRKFKGKSLVGCITVPGDRTNAMIEEVARVAGRGFDRLIIREDEDLRGRSPGEVACLLKEGAIRAGMEEEKITIVLPEREAFIYGVEHCYPGEMFVMFYEHLEPLEREIQHRLKQGGTEVKAIRA